MSEYLKKPVREFVKGFAEVHVCTIPFCTKTSILVNQTFPTPIIIRHIKLQGNLFTDDKVTIELSAKTITKYGKFDFYPDWETRFLKITPTFGDVRIGFLQITYEGAEYLKDTYIGSSAPIQEPVEIGQYHSTPPTLSEGTPSFILLDQNGRPVVRLSQDDIGLATSAKQDTIINKLSQPTDITPVDISVTTTATALFGSSTPNKSAILLADSQNTDVIYVGNSTNQLFPLSAGAYLKTEIDDLAKIYVKSASGTQTLHVIYES